MSEQEAKKYTSIRNLREEITRDMEDYKLFVSVDDYVGHHTASVLLGKENDHYKRAWFIEYLKIQIDSNISKLKELVEQNND
jgi:hypothetical protein